MAIDYDGRLQVGCRGHVQLLSVEDLVGERLSFPLSKHDCEDGRTVDDHYLGRPFSSYNSSTASAEGCPLPMRAAMRSAMARSSSLDARALRFFCRSSSSRIASVTAWSTDTLRS